MSNQPTLSPEVKLYFEERLRSLSITEEVNRLSTPIYEGVEGGVKATKDRKESIFFEPHPEGIQINYFLPNGHHMTWRKEGNKWPSNYKRIRLQKPKQYEKDGQVQTAKYIQEKGSPVFPFLTPGVIKAWVEGKKIKTLFLIEGEFKAFKGWMAKEQTERKEEVEFVGLPGIHGFYGGDLNHKQEINEVVQQIILDCHVEQLALVTDSDTLTVNYKEGKDLYLRPKSFANAVKNFRNSVKLLLHNQDCALSRVYFLHLKTKLLDKAKGLDDLILAQPAKTTDIIEDLCRFDFALTYFDGIQLLDEEMAKVDKYFGIDGKENFYTLYKEFIGARPFIYKKIKYEWGDNELKYVKSEEADLFMRVGIDWLKKVKTPNHRGLLEERVQRWSVAEIKRDYPKYIADQLINKDIPRYDAFFIEPCFDLKEYKRVLHGCYNLMEPLMWDPKPGRFDQTIKFLKHIFGGEGSITWNEQEKCYEEHNVKADQFSVALDYLTILHQHPKQKTFVPCLVSKEQGTGKTTFLEWLCTVYNGNGTILDNERFKMNFNGHYASKFIIGLDEGFLDVEKKAERERLKKMVTSKTMFLEMKGVDVKEIPYYGHLIICSNDADSLMKMEEEDTRWFVVKVDPIDQKDKDPDYEKKLMEEIPHYLHYIQNRKIFHPKEDRLWFSPKDFETEQMRKIIQVTKARLDAVVENWVKDIFLTYKVEELRINRKTMLRQLNNPEVSKYKIDEKELKYFLEEKRKLKYQGAARCKIPRELEIFGETVTVKYWEEVQRHYLFKPEEWLSDEEYLEYKAGWNVNPDEVKKEVAKAMPAGSVKDLFDGDAPEEAGF